MSQQRQSKEQLFQAFQRLQPTITLNQVIGQPQLFSMVNQLSLSSSNLNYDDQTFEELIERVSQLFGNLTISNFLDVHIQAVDILSFRIEQLRQNRFSLQDFIDQLHSRINELQQQLAYSNSNQQQEGFQVVFKGFTIQGQVPSNSLQIRIFNEAMNIDQVIQFQNKGSLKVIQLENQSAPIDSLLQVFQIEVFDNQRNFGFAQLNVFQLNTKFPKKIVLPLSLDSMNANIDLEVEGNVIIQNIGFAQEDLQQLKQALNQLSDDIIGLEEQYQGLNLPFKHAGPNVQPVIAQQKQQPDVYDTYQQQPQQHQQPFDNYPAQQNNKVLYAGNPNPNEDCDFSTKTLSNNLHTFLIGYLITAVVFCVKRSMFFDVSISIALLAILYKINLTQDVRAPQILKLFVFFFIFSAVLDLVWLIVFFPGWSLDTSSEDKGAQSFIRILVLAGSLLFMVYKILVIVAVIYLQGSVASNGNAVREGFHKFLDGESQPSASQHQQQQSQVRGSYAPQAQNYY